MAEVGQATQLDFNQAMQDFAVMFPDMDTDVIEAVLRANQGAVHATIDQLLTMTTDTEDQKTVLDRRTHLETHMGAGRPPHNELPPSYALSATPPPSYQQAVPSPHRSPIYGHGMASCAEGRGALRDMRNWSPAILLPLPNDFLRLIPPPNQSMNVLSPHRLSQRLNENALAREAVGESDAELAQYLADERIALFLQNDEFMNELRTNREFMNSLQKDYEGEGEECDAAESSTSGARRGNGSGRIGPPLDDATLRARIATMGKASRKKFAQIAKVFSRGKRSSGGRGLLPGGEGSANGRDQLLMSSDPLIDDDEEERGSQTEAPLSSSPRKLQ